MVFQGRNTNDSFCGAPLGSLKFSDWEKADLYNVIPAICFFMKTLRDTLPKADIYCFINNDIKCEICQAMREVSKRYQVHIVECIDIDLCEGHPTKLGMQRIKNSFLNLLKQ